MLKDRADLVTQGARGAGVEELINALLEDDLARFDAKVQRHKILLGRTVDKKEEVCISPYRSSILVAGPSGSGKSTAATGVVTSASTRRASSRPTVPSTSAARTIH